MLVDAQSVLAAPPSGDDAPGVADCNWEANDVRLLWIGVIPGAGAKQLRDAWNKTPVCDFGLTIVNLNDPMKHEPWHISDQDEQLLKEMVDGARNKCRLRSDVFINNARFYPRLKGEYANLVRAYTTKAREVGAIVHDGQAFLKEVKLRDHMHFAETSTQAVVDMYFSAVEDMLSQRLGRAAEH